MIILKVPSSVTHWSYSNVLCLTWWRYF